MKEGGNQKKIHLHPNANKNGFAQRPHEAGRKPKRPEIEALLDEVLGDEKDGISAAKAVFMKLRQQAMQGNIKAAQLLIEHAYGKPRQRIEIEGGEDIGRNAPTKTVLIQYRTDSISENDSSGGSAESNGDADKQGE